MKDDYASWKRRTQHALESEGISDLEEVLAEARRMFAREDLPSNWAAVEELIAAYKKREAALRPLVKRVRRLAAKSEKQPLNADDYGERIRYHDAVLALYTIFEAIAEELRRAVARADEQREKREHAAGILLWAQKQLGIEPSLLQLPEGRPSSKKK